MAEGDITTIRIETDFGNIGAISNFCYLSLTDDPTWDGRIVDVWIDTVLPFYVAMLSPDCSVPQFEIHPIKPASDLVIFRDVIPPQVGGWGNEAAPGQVAAKVTWYVDGSHRSQRGRTFIGGLSNDSIFNQRRLTDDFTALCSAWAEMMMATWGPDGTESTARFCVLSRFLNGALRSEPVALPVVAWAIPNIIGTQRRRLL